MSIFRRLMCRWNNRLALAALSAILWIAGAEPDGSRVRSELPPFLEEFRTGNLRKISAETVSLISATGGIQGYFTKHVTNERLPALVIVHDQSGLDEWTKQSAREFASIGYAVFAVDLRRYLRATRENAPSTEERTQADLAACVRWLRQRPDVYVDRIGVVGWGWGGTAALRLAGSMALQACVVCDATPALREGDVRALTRTPVLIILSGDRKSVESRLRTHFDSARISSRFFVLERTRPGFMIPARRGAYAREQAEDAWFALYEFLGKHVEDAGIAGESAIGLSDRLPEGPATIADIMRVVNSPAGIRGALSESLSTPPGSDVEWNLVRSRASILVEAGNMLKVRTPERGSRESWLHHADAYAEASRSIVAAAAARNYMLTQRALEQLTRACSACHIDHR